MESCLHESALNLLLVSSYDEELSSCMKSWRTGNTGDSFFLNFDVLSEAVTENP